jgi:uncharacterized protein (DUF1810 family)
MWTASRAGAADPPVTLESPACDIGFGGLDSPNTNVPGSGAAGSQAEAHNGSMPYDLDRFLDVQRDVYDDVLAELRRGRKTGHWMWFIFPQVAGLGHSPTSRYFAISSLDEARAYLAHPVLGARLRECAGIVLESQARTAEQIFGSIDARKLRSSTTLFQRASPDEALFAQVLERYFAGAADEATDARLG